MKKLMVKDKKKRFLANQLEKKRFLLRSIARNNNFSDLTKWNAFEKLNNTSRDSSFCKISNRCVISINRKRFNKLSYFSRMILLKLIRLGYISGIRKSSW